MKTLAEIDAILRDAQNTRKARLRRTAFRRGTPVRGTLIRKACAALAEVVAAVANPEPAAARVAKQPAPEQQP